MLHASPGVAPGSSASTGWDRYTDRILTGIRRETGADDDGRIGIVCSLADLSPVVCGHRDDRAVQAAAARISAEQAAWICWSTRPGAGMSSSMPERRRNGMPRCGSSRWACSMLGSPTGCVRIPPRWHNARRLPAGQPGGDRLGGDLTTGIARTSSMAFAPTGEYQRPPAATVRSSSGTRVGTFWPWPDWHRADLRTNGSWRLNLRTKRGPRLTWCRTRGR
jgi:hypothetical protein